MTRLPRAEPADERLRQLLALEERLQGLVQSARDAAALRIAAEHTEAERRLAAAHEDIERTARDEARAEHEAHVAALTAIATAHRATLAALTNLTETRLDELARRALRLAIGGDGDRP